MSGTRSASPTARATDAALPRDALIVAHGSPVDPAPQEARLACLAAGVGALLPEWRVRGATLAAPDALETALGGLHAPRVLPFFMAEGWFTRTELPRRLASAGADAAPVLLAFGSDPGLPDLAARIALDAAVEAGIDPGATTLLLAAHGSQVSPASARATRAMAATLSARCDFARVAVGFVEEAPYLVDAARGLGQALCLPLFALRAGHVVDDMPEALGAAGFAGPLLPPIGEHAAVPALLAAALRRSVGEAAA